MEFNTYYDMTGDFNLIPVYEKMTADLETPVSAFLKLKKEGIECFLFESVEGIGTIARYSYIGIAPKVQFFNKKEAITIIVGEKSLEREGSIFDLLKEEISDKRSPQLNELPSFTGGIVGYLGFENISLIEPSIQFTSPEELPLPDSMFGLYDSIIAFDHLRHQIIIIKNIECSPGLDFAALYKGAKDYIAEIKKSLSAPVPDRNRFTFEDIPGEEERNTLEELIENAKENIVKGDVFQLVLSKRFSSHYNGNLFNLYRALRIINPSPYMYYMEFSGGLVIIGTSPEDLLKVQNRKAAILPIAGTRRRGKDELEDRSLADELINDPKEIAEHTMLVDLARNDLGRVCSFGSIEVTEKMKIHYFSHVMHLVSRVEGVLKEDKDCIDALMASFPAGTVTGAPKIRAIQLINEYEKIKRGIYAGAVGYIDFKGNLDMCIAIRTLFADREKIYRQAGAGIVADSIPALEIKEINNKSAVLVNALKFAEVIDENSCN